MIFFKTIETLKTKKGVSVLFSVLETLFKRIVDSEITFEIKTHVMYPAEKKGINASKSKPHNLEPIIPKATTNIPMLNEAHNGPKKLFEYLVFMSENAKKRIRSLNFKDFFI